MAELSWWRSWHGAPTDNKWLLIASKAGVKPIIVSGIVWALLDYASQQKDRGSIAGFDTETFAVFSGIDESEIKAVIQALTDKKLLVDGRWAKWEDRQPKSEKEIQRVTEYRQAKKAVTVCYDALQNVTQDTDTDKEEKEEEREAASFSGLTPELLRNDWITPQMEAQAIIQKVTGLAASPPQEIEKYTPVILAIKDRENGGHVEYLKGYYADWCARRTKDGKPYKKTALGWVEWALEGASPAAPTQPTRRRKPVEE